MRHGDAMHNDIFNLGFKNIDSSLTPIGIMQAYILGEKLQNQPEITLENSCILSSYLNRAQHTALLALYSALKSEDTYFESVINLFNNMALERIKFKLKKTQIKEINTYKKQYKKQYKTKKTFEFLEDIIKR